MKNHLTLCVSAIALISSGLSAQEANPFTKKSEPVKPGAPAGNTFSSVVEFCTVSSATLREWIDQHPIKDGDASDLRKQMQLWIDRESTAKLVHTAFSVGVGNRKAFSSSVLEQTYPTSLEPSKTGGWFHPTNAETRNLGFSSTSIVAGDPSSRTIKLNADWSQMIGDNTSYDPVAIASKSPGDIVFVPKFWSLTASQPVPSNTSKSSDPFSAAPPESEPQWLNLESGKTHLVARLDFPNEISGAPPTTGLVFFRGNATIPTVNLSSEMVPESYQISTRFIRVPQVSLSAWLHQAESNTTPSTGSETVAAWLKSGEAKVVQELSIPGRSGSTSELTSVTEYVYPTEWGFSVSSDANDRSNPQAFETRNIGFTLKADLTADSHGLLLDFSADHVSKLGDTVVRRTKIEKQWIPDATYPLFGSFNLQSSIRIDRSKWAIAGSGAAFLPDGNPDATSSILVLLKVD